MMAQITKKDIADAAIREVQKDGISSCLAITVACQELNVDEAGFLWARKDYRMKAKARHGVLGFEDIPHTDWSNMPRERRAEIRCARLKAWGDGQV